MGNGYWKDKNTYVEIDENGNEIVKDPKQERSEKHKILKKQERIIIL